MSNKNKTVISASITEIFNRDLDDLIKNDQAISDLRKKGYRPIKSTLIRASLLYMLDHLDIFLKNPELLFAGSSEQAAEARLYNIKTKLKEVPA